MVASSFLGNPVAPGLLNSSCVSHTRSQILFTGKAMPDKSTAFLFAGNISHPRDALHWGMGIPPASAGYFDSVQGRHEQAWTKQSKVSFN
jgi:hypothetical protein